MPIHPIQLSFNAYSDDSIPIEAIPHLWLQPSAKRHGSVGMVPMLELANWGLLQCEAPKIAKLVYNSNNYGVWYL